MSTSTPNKSLTTFGDITSDQNYLWPSFALSDDGNELERLEAQRKAIDAKIAAELARRQMTLEGNEAMPKTKGNFEALTNNGNASVYKSLSSKVEELSRKCAQLEKGQKSDTTQKEEDKLSKVEAENRMLKAELKQKETIDELKEMKTKVTKMEQQENDIASLIETHMDELEPDYRGIIPPKKCFAEVNEELRLYPFIAAGELRHRWMTHEKRRHAKSWRECNLGLFHRKIALPQFMDKQKERKLDLKLKKKRLQIVEADLVLKQQHISKVAKSQINVPGFPHGKTAIKYYKKNIPDVFIQPIETAAESEISTDSNVETAGEKTGVNEKIEQTAVELTGGSAMHHSTPIGGAIGSLPGPSNTVTLPTKMAALRVRFREAEQD